jgi:signal transduction histidine kinase
VIDNAIKYTDKGYVRVSVEKRANDVLMSVKDSGLGISEASMKDLGSATIYDNMVICQE